LNRYEHTKLGEALAALGHVPADQSDYAEWIKAGAHLQFLVGNARSSEVLIYGSSTYVFVHAVAVPNDRLFPLENEDLLQWSYNPFNSIASYVTGGGRDDVWVDRGGASTGTTTLQDAKQLVFGRTFEGWSGPDASYFELNQEYAHLAEIHWRPEARAYCRFDENGDLEPVVTITDRSESNGEFSLVSFKWDPLEEYLAASNMTLVRMFDFTLLRHGDFNGWPSDVPERVVEENGMVYRQRVVEGRSAYTRGFQTIEPRRSAGTVATAMRVRWAGRSEKQYAAFIAYDWRNRRIRKISTDPAETTNYFEADGNDLPFELSPAFFRPEVLLKYKGDRDKYTVTERDVSCRSAWRLQAIDVNEAGQVHAYICYLRNLPYAEQLHWLSFNEPPKTGISSRAVATDFEGKWTTEVDPVLQVLAIARRWQRERVSWWSLRDERLLDRVSTPVTASRDEWAEAFLELSKLVIEGFETKRVRAQLEADDVEYDESDRSIALLEKLAAASGSFREGEEQRLAGLRTVQLHRSKTKGHVGGSEADRLAQEALRDFGTFGKHFHGVCRQVAEEMEMFERLFEVE
jgi:hypothetical protein